jgi:hypothetical protein
VVLTAPQVRDEIRRVKRRSHKLAASFVVTVAALPACKKTSIVDGEPTGVEATSIGAWDGKCTLNVPVHCPKGATCNPPAPDEIDCPPAYRDAAAPAPISRRPPGKESWVRVKPRLWAYDGRCWMVGERFCAPPPRPLECTTWPDQLEITCTRGTRGSDAGDGGAPAHRIESFVWRDGVGACHKVAAFECSGPCALPEGEIGPCS